MNVSTAVSCPWFIRNLTVINLRGPLPQVAVKNMYVHSSSRSRAENGMGFYSPYFLRVSTTRSCRTCIGLASMRFAGWSPADPRMYHEYSAYVLKGFFGCLTPRNALCCGVFPDLARISRMQLAALDVVLVELHS
jgi:hypothetical protein